jgi:hypothetical protein
MSKVSAVTEGTTLTPQTGHNGRMMPKISLLLRDVALKR